MLEQKLEQDLKTALLARDELRVTTLRGIKSSLLNLKISAGKRESGLSDNEVLQILSKEAKKRQESADMYVLGADQARADKELTEKAIIDAYLPAQLSESEISNLIDEILTASGATPDKSAMGPTIAAVKAKVGGSADGGLIARLVKEKLGL